jgi:hypothetical protein
MFSRSIFHLKKRENIMANPLVVRIVVYLERVHQNKYRLLINMEKVTKKNSWASKHIFLNFSLIFLLRA